MMNDEEDLVNAAKFWCELDSPSIEEVGND